MIDLSTRCLRQYTVGDRLRLAVTVAGTAVGETVFTVERVNADADTVTVHRSGTGSTHDLPGGTPFVRASVPAVVGCDLPNGARVLAVAPADRPGGAYVLAQTSGAQSFAVWFAYRDEDGAVQTVSGDYRRDLMEAVDAFKRRARLAA